jgi:hypothetical protein
MKAIRLDKLAEFIKTAKTPARGDKINYEFIVHQLEMFANGFRGAELHDMCISLIEGEVEID